MGGGRIFSGHFLAERLVGVREGDEPTSAGFRKRVGELTSAPTGTKDRDSDFFVGRPGWLCDCSRCDSGRSEFQKTATIVCSA
jgi:hypothetical protein